MRSFFEKKSFVLIVATIAFVCFAAVVIINLADTAIDRKNESEALKAELASQQAANEKLEKELAGGISEEEKEYIARNDLGYILPGEHVYADAS